MRVGWLEDPSYRGGAELDGEALRAVCPHDVVMMPPGEVRDADMYIVGNCVHYLLAHLRPLEYRDGAPPIVKIVNDAWRYAIDPKTRDFLLARADLFILRSPLHQERIRWPIPEDKVRLLPSWVDLDRFPGENRHREDRVLWLANVESAERLAGLKAIRAWAAEHDVPVDAYGRGTKNGPVDYDEVANLMASHRWYGHAMGHNDYEPYGRATVEAWAAGCNLVVGQEIGALWWIEHHPDQLATAAEDFWTVVEETCLASV